MEKEVEVSEVEKVEQPIAFVFRHDNAIAWVCYNDDDVDRAFYEMGDCYVVKCSNRVFTTHHDWIEHRKGGKCGAIMQRVDKLHLKCPLCHKDYFLTKEDLGRITRGEWDGVIYCDNWSLIHFDIEVEKKPALDAKGARE